MSSSRDNSQEDSGAAPSGSDRPRVHPADAATRLLLHPELEAAGMVGAASDETDFVLEGDSIQPGHGLPSLLGEYEIQEQIGAGGMGQVFRARHRTMQRDVAIKILPNLLSVNPSFVQRFQTEVQAIGKLMHPNIVTAFDAGYTESIHYLVMEFVDGISLSSRVATQGVLSVPEAVDFLVQAASALNYAHSMGVIHRDIKPGNMMLTNRGVLKILDFGLADIESSSRRETTGKQLVGTIEYMSPEQIDRPSQVDQRTDIYSLGVTLFYLLTGHPMFSGEIMHIAMSHRQVPPPALYELRNDCDLRLDAIFQRMVAKKTEDRFSDATEIIEALEECGLRETRRSAKLPGIQSLIGSSATTAEGTTSGNSSYSTSSKELAAIGIDFGMIHSRASYLDSNRQLLELPIDGTNINLRNMLWSDGEQISIGESANNYRASRPGQMFYGLQRWFGLPYIDRSFAGRNVPPEVLAASVLRYIIDGARRHRSNLTHAVLTVPACYDQLHRASIVTASRIAGIELLQLLDTPLAAALSFLETQSTLNGNESRRRNSTEHILTITLNGSCCEAAVLRVEGTEVTCLGTSGDWKRGKLRWQHRLAEHLAMMFVDKFKEDVRKDLVVASRLQRTVELAIDRLLSIPKIDMRFEAWQKEIRMPISREDLLQIAGDLIHDLNTMPKRAMKLADIEPKNISRVLLIGDMFGLPQLKTAVKQVVGPSTPIHRMEKSDIARGAAIQAKHLIPPVDMSLPHAQVSTAYDIGLVLLDSERSKAVPRVVVPRGTAIPYQSSRTLRLKAEGHKQIRLQFAESTRLGNFNWHRLGGLDVEKSLPSLNLNDPLQLLVEVDPTGLFHAKLTWLRKNLQATIPTLADPMMDHLMVRQWRDWLETVMLCNM